mgnify:FL=1
MQGCQEPLVWYQTVPLGYYDYKEIEMHTTCGTSQTDVEGHTRTRLCETCYHWYQERYPQGWSCYPGDTCQHGVYVGGVMYDYLCPDCEAGDGVLTGPRKRTPEEIARQWESMSER